MTGFYKFVLSGVCLLLVPCATVAGERPEKKPAAKKPAVRKAAPKTASPATAGAVIVKDWESGPNATRAAQPGDFPAATGNTASRSVSVAQRNGDGSLDYTGPELMTTLTVTKAADGSVSYQCNQGGDHSKHKHPAPAKATGGEVK